jgi:outer membrane protein assembly factor BamA
MKHTTAYKYSLVTLCLLCGACSITKRLPPDEKLYTGAKVVIESSSEITAKKKRFIKAATKDAIRPSPNKSYLGIRPKLWIYMSAVENPKTKFGKWVKSKGEPPVLLSTVNPTATSNTIDTKLFNIGIFKGYTQYKTVEKKSTAKIVYTCYVHKPFKIKELTYAITNDSISKIVQAGAKKSLVKIRHDYNLDLLKAERTRIDDLLKNKGYFYFNPDYLIFEADTSSTDSTNHSVSLSLGLKENSPQNALTIFRINKVFIDQNFTLRDANPRHKSDTILVRDYLFSDKVADMNIRPRVILRAIHLRKNEVYSRRNHDITLNRLMSMGTFKFVQVQFTESETREEGLLDVAILMTTMKNMSFRAEMDLVSKSNNFKGPRINMGLTHRNTFRGAELLNLNLAGSYEAQLSRNSENLYSYSVNPEVELVFPRLVLPFRFRGDNKILNPKTRIALSYNFLKRVSYFDMRTLQFRYVYGWKENRKQEHEFSPVNLSYTSIRNKSPQFNDLLETNPFLKKSYEEQFIGGANYTFTYNEQVLPQKRVQYYLQGIAETGGNLFSLVKLIGGSTPTSETPSTLLGSIYSQYAKVSIDARSFINIMRANKLATRFFVGAASPYGNSAVLPYSKQFFSGGSNSLRAFHINTVGPGTYNQENENTGFLQMGGDLKLELNSEFRFSIYKLFKGALFIDAGNVWQLSSNPANIGSPFTLSGFMNELAVGGGVGIRLDVSFFLLRFDLATPLRKPWLDSNQRWVINQIDFGSAPWRKENLILNVAIGYPF